MEETKGRVVAIDYGKKRVGIAVTDELQLIANALTTVNTTEILSFLKKYVIDQHVVLFVVGKPTQMNYQDSEASKYIEPFIAKLKKEFPVIPVERVDERFTSKMAFQTMIDAGLNKKARQNKALVDSISATIILQSYLESSTYQSKKKNS